MKPDTQQMYWLKDKTVLKDALIILGWAAALIIIAGLCWYFSQPLRNRLLVNAVNQVLEQSGDSRRVLEPVSLKNTRAPGLGRWYSFTGDSRIYIFTFIGEGAFFPCAAVQANDGKVQELIALNKYGARVLNRISPEIINIYSQRIEKGTP